MTSTTKRLEKKSAGKNNAAKATRAGFSDPAVDAVFNAYPKPIKARLLALRRLIFDTAKTTKGVGALLETLKWGQPSYLTAETKSGSTIRIDEAKSGDECGADPDSRLLARVPARRSSNCHWRALSASPYPATLAL